MASEAATGTSTDTSTSGSTLPSHPTARAFFDALDLQKQKNDTSTSTTSSNSTRRCSAFVQKQLTSLGWRNRHSQDPHYPVTVLDVSFQVQQMQRGEIEGTYGTGACVWPAAMVLVKYMERHSHLLRQKVVVDLGSGTGLTSIAAAILGAKVVVCTDGCDPVVQLARDNIRKAAAKTTGSSDNDNDDQNAAVMIQGCPIYTQELWWGRDSIHPSFLQQDDNATCTSNIDVVLVADCVLPKLYPIAPLVAEIDQLLPQSTNSMALISYEHRYYPEYDPRDKFLELAQQRGLTVLKVPMEEHDPTYSVDDIEICKVMRTTQPKPKQSQQES
ncbi:Protein-lysine methyltransferase METTL21D [Seminavis robusta]|uniref:Protein-lysine methyltransferase METTL21D n=1 Tax=Seminavis robusta TaxID=568900 RepID=A0A9N8D4N1_9STRA|nr:Protein-lysine methyltransferase METTL21D [Seminavis robusta]|eukprot:Sro3_g002730.1 Protein-lysine methyltransferase METTL21D (329) ;mRNA; r:225443-226429